MLYDVLCNLGHTETGIPLMQATYLYWKMVVYQNITPGLVVAPSILTITTKGSFKNQTELSFSLGVNGSEQF